MQRHAELFASLLLFFTIGCGASANFGSTATDTSSAGVPLSGHAMGGQQPITGAHVYLMTAGSTGYASASKSILTKGDGSDTVGYYVLTNASGYFSITGDYTCTPGALTYIMASGGNPGLYQDPSGPTVNNPAAILVDSLGPCPSNGTFLGAIPNIVINEATTVAAAFSMAGFAADSTHVGAANTTQSATGLSTAFSTAMQLVSPYAGYTYGTTPAVSGYATAQGLSGNGTVPYSRINTLANILFACVNSDGVTGPCSTLFTYAKNSSGVAPTDVFTAAVNMAQHPTTNVGVLFNLNLPNAPFQPSLGSTPKDLTLAVTYTAPGTSTPMRSALDASGNLWIPNYGNNTITQLSSTGVVLSGTTGLSGSNLNQPEGLAVSPQDGTVFVANNAGNVLSKFNANGSAAIGTLFVGSAYNISYASNGTAYVAYSGGNASVTLGGVVASLFASNATSYGVALTSAGSAWATGFASSVLNNQPGLTMNSYSGGGMNSPASVVTDASGNFWVANTGANSISKLNSAGQAVSGSTGYTGGGLNSPWGLAVDGLGKVFVANSNGSISEFASDGTAISTSTGYVTASTGKSYSVAIDNAGNVWSPNSDGKIYKFIGLAAPVSLPLSNTTAGVRP